MIIVLQIKFFLLLLLVISSFFVQHTAAFYGDPNIPLTIPSTYGSLALTVKDSIYLIGGRVVLHNTSDVNMNNISVITFSSNGEMQIQNKVPINPPESCYPCYGYSLPDGDTIVVANVPYPSYNYTAPDNFTDILQPGGLGYYHISNNSWTYAGRSPRYSGTLSPLMKRFSSAISTDKKFIYVLGGEYDFGGYIKNNNYDLKFDINNSSNVQEVNFNATISTLSGSSATLPSGNTVIAFGKYYDAEKDIEIMNSTSQVLLFDEKTEKYTLKQIKADSRGRFPVGRIDASCALGPDNSSIYFFGGSDSIIGANYTTNQYNVTVYNDIAILDTVTWSWILPDIPGLKPLPTSETSMTLFDTNKLFISTGRQGYIYTGSPSVLSDVSSSSQFLLSNNLKWFTNNPHYDDYHANKNGLNDGAIAGIIIGVFAILAILLALLWVYVPNTKRVVNYIQQDLIWSPRSGEPLWAETSRLLVRFILLFLFLAFVAFVIWKSVNSATVVQQIKNPVNAVLAPDVRFCFDGFNQSSLDSSYNPFVTCLLRNGTNCSGKILPLDISMYPPASNFGTLSCFLFLPGLDYYLVNDKGGLTDSAGTKLIFSFFAQNTTADITKGVIYVDFYAPNYDANTVMYNLTKLENTKLTQTQIDQWVVSEQANNVVDTIILKQTVKSTASYSLTTKKTLKNDGWNYIGFSSNYDETVSIDNIFKEVPQNDNNMPQTFYTQPLAQLTVQPSEFTENFDVEQRVFTLLNAFAQAGGVLGLFIALQTILFGFRPQSPWGIVHRWSFGKLRVRLTDRLANYFNKTGTPVPLVNPVSNRLSVVNGQSYFKDDVESTYVSLGPNVPSANDSNETIDEEERIQRVEERLQLMELLLKSYYLNDEVFRSLDQAVKRGKRGRYQGKFVNSGTKDSDSALNNNILNEEFALNDSKEETSTAEVKRRPSSTVFQQRDIYQPRLAPDPIELLYDNDDHLVNTNEKKQ